MPFGPPCRGERSLRPLAPAAQCLEAAAVLLRRPRAEVGAERSRSAPLKREPLALLLRLGRLRVERRGDGRRAAPFGEPGHDNGAPRGAETDLELVAGPDLTRRLHALAADLDMPGEDELGRGAPRLREPRRPQPFVDA